MNEDEGGENRERTFSEWEVIPSISPPPEELKHLLPPTPNTPDQPKLLCGYLKKETSHSIIKTFKMRWVVFDDSKCCLNYFNTKTDSTPQGSIDISQATFAYAVDNLSRCQFEVCTPLGTFSFQAATQEAMFQWIEALQKKRHKFAGRRKEMVMVVGEEVGDVELMREGGLTEGKKGSDSEEEVIAPLTHEEFGESPRTNLQQRLKKRLSKTMSRSYASPNLSNRKSNFFTRSEIEETRVDGCVSQIHSESNSTALQPDSSPDVTRSWLRRPHELLKKVSTRGGSDESSCPKCQMNLETMEFLQEQLLHKEQEVKDRDELIDFFRKEIKLADMQEEVRKEFVMSQIPDSKVDMITQRDQLIDSLQRSLEESRIETEQQEEELRTKRKECAELADEVALYKETLTAKDHVVIELTNKLFMLERGEQPPSNRLEAMLPTPRKELEQEIVKLKERAEAFKSQNLFLNEEIMQMSDLRMVDAETIRSLKHRLQHKDAEYVRLQSKHIVLLKETQSSLAENMEDVGGIANDLVSQMLKEAMEHDLNLGLGDSTRSDPAYDVFGFRHDMSLDAGSESVLDTVEKRVTQRASQIDEVKASQQARWENFMAQYPLGKDIVRSEELKQLIRGGIPKVYRGRVWKCCIRNFLGKHYVPALYNQLLTANAGKTSLALNQIELDLLRTLPSNKYYSSPDAPGIAKLRRVLVAYSWYDAAVGYCQGLNRLAAITLLFMDEEDAFWCLVAVVQFILPEDYYNKTLLGSQTDQRVLRDLIADKMPRLNAHLNTCDIDFSLITFNWFHTVFIDNLPVPTMLRIWDTFLYEGSKVMFRYAIAIFKYNEEGLMAMENSISIFNRLRTMAQSAVDVNRLTHIAFHDPMLRSFPRKMINAKRAYYRGIVKSELDRLDSHRTLTSSSSQNPMESDSDEEED